jgi:hypothetical protein
MSLPCFRAACVAACLLLAAGIASAAQVTVRVEPPLTIVPIFDTFTVDLVADITVPVLGWGLDIDLSDPAVASVVGLPAIGGEWVPASSSDGDGLAGVAFPSSVQGADILLATITYSADALGVTDLIPGVTPGDLTEGFALDPDGFATLELIGGQVFVLPEPATLLLLGVAGGFLVSRRRPT